MWLNRLFGTVGVLVLSTATLGQTTQPTSSADPFEPPENIIVKLPDGREVNLADLQRDGAGLMIMKSMDGDGTTVHATDEDGRRIRITENDEEIVVVVKDGDAEPVEYRAANADELEEKHPEAYELYQKYSVPEITAAGAGGPPAGMVGHRMALRMGGSRNAVVDSLGCVCSPVLDPFVKAHLGEGVIVVRVPKDSIGESLGLQKFDLIKKINNKDIQTIEQLEDAISDGDDLSIEVVRAGKETRLSQK